jgi:NTE family protein
MAGLGLVLSGGGAPAAYFGAGVVRALEEQGIVPDLLSGVSAGALNACAIGHGLNAAELAELWSSVSWRDIYGIRRDVWNAVDLPSLLRPGPNLIEYAMSSLAWTWLFDTSPARRTLASHLGGETLTVEPGRTVVVSAVEQATGEVVRFCNHLPKRPHRAEGTFVETALTVDHALASAAVPLLFPPGRIGGKSYADAGLVANTPLAPIMAYEPDAVIIVSGSGVARPARDARTWGEAVGLLVNNVTHFALMSDYKHAQTVNELAIAAPRSTGKRNVPMLLITPSDLGFSLGGFLHFDTVAAAEVMEYGYSEASRALRAWRPAQLTLI